MRFGNFFGVVGFKGLGLEFAGIRVRRVSGSGIGVYRVKGLGVGV